MIHGETVRDAREKDLAMMIRRLAGRIKLRAYGEHAPDDLKLVDAALDFLRRYGLEGSPLRHDGDHG